MMWKAIGKSVIGTSHIAAGKKCEDVLQYQITYDSYSEELLICCASDGAGSAKYGAEAAKYCVERIMANWTAIGTSEWMLFQVMENIYDKLEELSREYDADLNEFSCTLMGCLIGVNYAMFFQIGDGAIIRDDGNGGYNYIWWPENGEYQNTTSFVIDDRNFGKLKFMVLKERINEVAMFTDGLQMLSLNSDTKQVHQPFFNGLFPHLRMADDDHKITILNRKLEEYLGSTPVNNRTDDDKTLFLATRLTQ